MKWIVEQIMNRGRCAKFTRCLSGVLAVAMLASCQQKMAEQPRYEPLAKSPFFDDERSARPLVDGTIAQGDLRDDRLLYEGKVNGKLADAFPFPINREVLERGQQRFDIYCAVCHDRIGTGEGMIVRRGYRAPPSYHIDRLREAPAGHFFDVISHGFGVMPDYSQQVSVRDRWAIVAYIRALQLSQHAALSELSEKDQRSLAGNP